jgi:hypothetical protein
MKRRLSMLTNSVNSMTTESSSNLLQKATHDNDENMEPPASGASSLKFSLDSADSASQSNTSNRKLFKRKCVDKDDDEANDEDDAVTVEQTPIIHNHHQLGSQQSIKFTNLNTPVVQPRPFHMAPNSLLKQHRLFDSEQKTPMAAAATNSNYSNQLVICNSFVYATCRDALNDEDLQSKYWN